VNDNNDTGPHYVDGPLAAGFDAIPSWLTALVGHRVEVHHRIRATDRVRVLGLEHLGMYAVLRTWWGPQNTRPWPSVEKIAARAGVGSTRARELIADLETVGAALRTSRGKRGGGRGSNFYTLAGKDGPLCRENETQQKKEQTNAIAKGKPTQMRGVTRFKEQDSIYIQTEKDEKPLLDAVDTSIAADLCEYLSQRIGEYRGGHGHRPRVDAGWIADMDRLIQEGPLGYADGGKRSPDEIRRAIAYVFAELAEPNRKAFCWAMHIRSPKDLSEKWSRLADVKRHREEVLVA
jgi:hypothetical protein